MTPVRARSTRCARRSAWTAGVIAVLAATSPGTAQDPVETAVAALDRCDAAGGSGDEAAAEAAASDAEGSAAMLPEDREADALVVRAQILTRCRIPFAGFMRQGVLVEESNGMLRRALTLDASHLGAMFGLGMNHYHTPAFLGRTGDAMEAFERLLEAHGSRDDPRVAAAYYYLGQLYERAGREESAASTWRAGSARFPDHEGLREKAGTSGRAGSKESAAVTADGGEAGGGAPDQPTTVAGAGEQPGGSTPVYRLDPIVVEASGYSMEDPRTATRLTKLDVYTLPGGTADVLQTFKTMPGVTQVTDGSDLYVRGGDPTESPIWVDGARLFYPGKFETLSGSMFGVLDPSTLRRAYFSAGGFSARYGNALSGVVDIATEGRPVERRLRLGANITSLGITTWQPLGARAGTWGNVSVTRTEALLALHGREDEFPAAPSAFQAMSGLVLEPSKGLELKASTLVESDETTVRINALGYEGPFRSTATTRLAAASARLMNDAGTAGLRLSTGASMRESTFAFGVLDRDAVDRGLTARLDGDLGRGRIQLRAGLEAARLEAIRDGSVPAGEELVPGSPALELDEASRSATHLGGYAEVESRVARDLAVITGLRADALPGEDGVTLDPRLAAAWRMADWTIRVGGGLFSQGRWRARPDLPNAGNPNGIALRARHLVTGVQRDGPLSVRAEVYLKDYEDYGPDPAGAGPGVVDGRARGVDMLVQWAGTDVVSGWITYSFLDSELDLEDGTVVSSAYDVTHTLAAVGKLMLGRSWELGLTGRYATGRPYTPILGAADPEPGRPLAPEYGPVMSARYPDYRRLDARLTRFVPLGARSLVFYLEALNLLDRRNVMGYTYDGAYRNPEPVESFFADRTLVLGVEMAF
jgi:vitamin B12 transporter